jgi:hypothetical protein
MQIQSYEHQNFASLAVFNEAERHLSEKLHMIPRLGKIICNYNIQDVVGVALLHKHFDVFSAERVVRKYECQEARIYPETNLADLAGCGWRFVDRAWYPVEFANTTNVYGSFLEAETLRANTEFLKAYGEELRLLDVANLFGLASLHGVRRLAPNKHQTILERNDGKRRLRLQIVDLQDLESINATQTLWTFEGYGRIDCPPPCQVCNTPLHCEHKREPDSPHGTTEAA